MRNPEYSSINPDNGNITYNGPISTEKGDHSHMPSRTEAYLPGDERGHLTASSLGGINTKANVTPQHADVNHNAFMSMEKGERTALQNHATIHSEKTAHVDSKPGDRAHTFTVNDTVTYQDGHKESIHHSFTNESYANQSAWNNMSATLPDTFDAANPGDTLRGSMDTASYSALMEETDASLTNLDADYAPADFSGLPGADDTGSCSADVCADGDSASADAGNGDGGASADMD